MGDFRETTDEKPEVNLDGVDPALHRFVRAMPGDQATSAAEAARRVMVNGDGTIIVRFLQSVDVRQSSGNVESVDRIRLRPLKARDYFERASELDAENWDFAATLRLGVRLASPAGAIEEIENHADATAVYMAVSVARKNYSRPKT